MLRAVKHQQLQYTSVMILFSVWLDKARLQKKGLLSRTLGGWEFCGSHIPSPHEVNISEEALNFQEPASLVKGNHKSLTNIC